VTEYRVLFAESTRDWAEAERLQKVCVEWERRRVEAILESRLAGTDQANTQDNARALGSDPLVSSPGQPQALRDRLAAVLQRLTDRDRDQIRALASSLHHLGVIQHRRGESACVEIYAEAHGLAAEIVDRAGAVACAFNLGTAFKDLSDIRDLDLAEYFYRSGLRLCDEHDRLGQSSGHVHLGQVALERFRDARAAGKPEAEQLEHINAALNSYLKALDMTPDGDVNKLAIVHDWLGVLYSNAGYHDRALPHYRESIRFREASGDIYGAAETRFNVALALARGGRFSDALVYALEAQAGYSSLGSAGSVAVREAQKLIEQIKKLAAEKGSR
jgi:tetratricopeptide (TPR) repeat protein